MDIPTIDSEFAGLLPELTADAHASLEKELIVNGLEDSIKVWKEENVILDGHNRIGILDGLDGTPEFDPKKHAPRYDYVSLPDRIAAKKWILDRARAQRNMTPAQLDYVIGLRYELEKKPEGAPIGSKNRAGNKRSQNDDVNSKRTCEALATELGVSAKTIERDGLFARSVDEIGEKAGLKAKQAILSGKVVINKALASSIASESPAKLKAAFEKGQDGVSQLQSKIKGEQWPHAKRAKKKQKQIVNRPAKHAPEGFDVDAEVLKMFHDIRNLFKRWPDGTMQYVFVVLDKLQSCPDWSWFLAEKESRNGNSKD